MDQKQVIEDLKQQVQVFCEARNWDQFHDAKELAIGTITEASELLEHFRFQNKEQIATIINDPEKRIAIGEELADVFFFLLRFCQRYDFDLSDCFSQKMNKNNLKYPAAEFFGKNHKSKK